MSIHNQTSQSNGDGDSLIQGERGVFLGVSLFSLAKL